MKLFRVTIAHTTYVVAEDHENAVEWMDRNVFSGTFDEETQDIDATEAKHGRLLADGWNLGSIPWGDNPDGLTIAEFLEKQA